MAKRNRKKREAAFGDDLVPREIETLAAFWSGFDVRGVAEILGVSVDTVKKYLRQIRVKIGLRTWAELYRYGLEHGHLEAPRKRGD